MDLHVETRGTGPPVVFTHGFATSGETWADQADTLAGGGFRVATWDLRGHGRSPAPVGDYRREAALEDLASVVASVSEGSPVLLVGHSVGGYLCLAHTLVHPETVAGLALVSTGPGFRNPERRAAYNRSMEKVAQRAGYPPSVAALAIQHDTLVIDGIPSIACPSVVIVGAEDLDVYVAGARYLAERLPRADLVEIKGAGHDPHRERPDEVNVALLGLAGLALA